MSTIVIVFTIIHVASLLIVLVYSQECLYNETMCACVFGSTEGSCYERTGTSANGVELCSTRVCNAGWTCDCLGDFFCTQADIDVYTRLETSDLDLTSSVPCQITKQRTVTSAGFELGYFHPQFSDNGLLAQQCQLFVWWLDGELQDAFSDPVTVTSSNLETVKTSLSDWNNLPLRKGSVIGFRWRNAPYSCYNSISNLNINGTLLDTTDTSAVSHRFTHIFENDWFAKDFVEGSGWSSPLTSIYSDTYGDLNTGVTNTYWRIKIL